MLPRLSLTIVAVAILAVQLAGCRSGAEFRDPSSPAVTSDAHYAFLFGQKYRTKTDLYIFAFTGDPEYRYVGTRAHPFEMGPGELPAEINRALIGKIYPRLAADGMGDLIIADVAPAGSVLTVRAETHDVTFMSSVRGSGGYPMGFICELAHDGKTDSVLSEFIQSHKMVSRKVPNQDISESVAEKIP